jgi:hypothetical protein
MYERRFTNREIGPMAGKSRKTLTLAFGEDEYGLTALPAKVGNRRVARLLFCRVRGGCSHCFPHGFETTNSTGSKNRRSWKHYRKTHFRRIA